MVSDDHGVAQQREEEGILHGVHGHSCHTRSGDESAAEKGFPVKPAVHGLVLCQVTR